MVLTESLTTVSKSTVIFVFARWFFNEDQLSNDFSNYHFLIL